MAEAILLNKKFKGRTLVRAIFFLPVILNSGAIMDAMDLARTMMSGGISNASADLAEAVSGSGVGLEYYFQMFGETSTWYHSPLGSQSYSGFDGAREAALNAFKK